MCSFPVHTDRDQHTFSGCCRESGRDEISPEGKGGELQCRLGEETGSSAAARPRSAAVGRAPRLSRKHFILYGGLYEECQHLEIPATLKILTLILHKVKN